MSIKQASKDALKEQKVKSRKAIAEKIDLALGEFKNKLDDRKYDKTLKKVSKKLSKVVMVPQENVIIEKKDIVKKKNIKP